MKNPVWQTWVVLIGALSTVFVYQNCSHTNNGINLSSTAVDERTLQIVQPLQDVNVTPGQDVVFQVGVVGSNPEYRWYKDGKLIEANRLNLLLLPSVIESTSGVYKVVVKNGQGSTESSATLNVAPKEQAELNLTLTPSKPFAVIDRDNVIITAQPTGGKEPYKFKWYFKSPERGAEVALTGSTSHRLVFTPLRPENIGEYRVEVTDGEQFADRTVVVNGTVLKHSR